MLETMGISVFAGFLTTFGASIFLLFCELAFFARFGVYICLTIVFSVIIALFVFSPLALLFGPEGDKGDLRFWLKKKSNSNSSNKQASGEQEQTSGVEMTEA